MCKNTEIQITDFLCNDLASYGSYDNVRKLPSYIDGMKMSQRKVVYTLMKKYPSEFVKTETLANITAAFTNYLHGANNIATAVCTTMTQNFVGANNYPLTTGNSGGWGCRINPTAAAPRYTRLKLSDISKACISEDDEQIIGRQYFEGDYIEPKFFVPTFPLLLLNGSNGLSTGFSSTIYPRNPKDVIKYIQKRLEGVSKPRIELKPWFKNFKGEIRKNSDTGQYESVGVITKVNTSKLIISELPIGVDYQKYIAVLDKLCESKVINDYDDNCEPKTDSIEFVIKIAREKLSKLNNDDLVKTFKLSKTLPENYNCIDENNRVREFKSIEEILEAYISIRKDFYVQRKKYIIEKMFSKCKETYSKYLFCDGVVKGTIKVANVKREKIVEQIEQVKDIIKVDNSYDYLLRMPIYSITEEKLKELKELVKKLKSDVQALMKKSEESIWMEDLSIMSKSL